MSPPIDRYAGVVLAGPRRGDDIVCRMPMFDLPSLTKPPQYSLFSQDGTKLVDAGVTHDTYVHFMAFVQDGIAYGFWVSKDWTPRMAYQHLCNALASQRRAEERQAGR